MFKNDRIILIWWGGVAEPTVCGSSQAKDQTPATVMTTPDP